MKQILNSIKLTLLINLIVFGFISLIGLIDNLLFGNSFNWEFVIWSMMYSTAFVFIFAIVSNEKITKWLARGLYIVFIVLFFVLPGTSAFSIQVIYLFFSLFLATKMEKLFLVFKDAAKKSKSNINPE